MRKNYIIIDLALVYLYFIFISNKEVLIIHTHKKLHILYQHTKFDLVCLSQRMKYVPMCKVL